MLLNAEEPSDLISSSVLRGQPERLTAPRPNGAKVAEINGQNAIGSDAIGNCDHKGVWQAEVEIVVFGYQPGAPPQIGECERLDHKGALLNIRQKSQKRSVSESNP
jgi:hypothetical protein